MKTLLVLIVKEKKVEQYNVFSTFKVIKRWLKNQFSWLDRIYYCLTYVEGHIAHESNNKDPPNPPSSKEGVPTTIASSHSD